MIRMLMFLSSHRLHGGCDEYNFVVTVTAKIYHSQICHALAAAALRFCGPGI